jgi:hypothetical protein
MKSMRCNYTDIWGATSSQLETGQWQGFWRSTSAITRVTIFPSGSELVAGSRITIYGMD